MRLVSSIPLADSGIVWLRSRSEGESRRSHSIGVQGAQRRETTRDSLSEGEMKVEKRREIKQGREKRP